MQDPALLKKLNEAIPLGRTARPDEIASVVAFLADAEGATKSACFEGAQILSSIRGRRE
jgi:NAD(P)-dependent dehydrogenase (short-subunit alcohol dehydrogenase family)